MNSQPLQHPGESTAIMAGAAWPDTTVVLELSVADGDSSPLRLAHELVTVVKPQHHGLPAAATLPAVTMTLPLGEAIHRALIRRAARGRRIDCPELTGQNRLGHPLTGRHQHAHVLPVDVDQDGYLDHVVIHAPMGLSETAQRAIREMRTLFGHGGQPGLRLRAVDRSCLRRFTQRLLADEPPAGAATWLSWTPLVLPRHVKRTGKHTLEGQVRCELASRGLPEAEMEVLPLPPRLFRHFVMARGPDHAPPPQRYGHALRLRFPQPVRGPIALGYASHFGLGLFRAEPRQFSSRTEPVDCTSPRR